MACGPAAFLESQRREAGPGRGEQHPHLQGRSSQPSSEAKQTCLGGIFGTLSTSPEASDRQLLTLSEPVLPSIKRT